MNDRQDEVNLVAASRGTSGKLSGRGAKTRRHFAIHSGPVFTTHTLAHTPAHWQGKDGFCGRSSVTAARSPGGDTSGAAPRVGRACLRWPRINNFSFGAETTGIVIKEME